LTEGLRTARLPEASLQIGICEEAGELPTEIQTYGLSAALCESDKQES
jgi:hypothetical protein